MSRRPATLFIAVGLVVGFALGLVYAWLIEPVQLYNTVPPLLRSDYRHDWIRMTALGYVADGDLERVASRLDGLDQEDIQTALAALIESHAAQGQSADTMRALSGLARRLGVETAAMLVYLSTPSPVPVPLTPTPPPSSPTQTPDPSPTTARRPTATATRAVAATPVSPPHRIVSQTVVCEGSAPLLQLFVRAAPEGSGRATTRRPREGTPLSGIVLWLTWPDGADRAVTGMRPWIDPGYADFELEPGVPYAVSVNEPNAPVLSSLMVQPCRDEEQEEPRMGSWRVILEIEQP